jgi:pyruvate dehydrogenase E2 component (dihydrolipoamide acetyltransferase)
MPVEVILPKVDMDMATGRISRWLVAEGALVKQGEPLFEIETDKAAMEVEAPASGTLHDVTGKEGVDIPVGLPVAWIYAEDEARIDRAEPDRQLAAPVADAASANANLAVALPSARLDVVSSGVRATPLARRLARQQRIDLAKLFGSGPRGRIQAQDIIAAASRVVPEALAEQSLRPSTGLSMPVTRRQATSSVGATWLRQGDGIPIVLIHGFGSETASWRPFLAAFERPGPILSLDLPGHGAAVDVVVDSFDDVVAYAEAQLAAQGLSVAHLAGHSLGGAVATALAAGSGLEARSLSLLAPAGFGPEINTMFTAGLAAARDEATLRVWMRELTADPTVFSDSFVKATVRTRADGRLAEAQTRLASRLFAEETQLFSVRALLDHLVIPVKVIAGTADRVIPCQHLAGLPGPVAVHLFPGIGHMPHLEDRASVARLLRELVQGASSA